MIQGSKGQLKYGNLTLQADLICALISFLNLITFELK